MNTTERVKRFFKKNKKLFLLKDSDIEYLKKCLKVFNIFIKATTKLQAEKYPTIYYLMPEIYNIYNSVGTLGTMLSIRGNPRDVMISRGVQLYSGGWLVL